MELSLEETLDVILELLPVGVFFMCIAVLYNADAICTFIERLV